MCLKEVGRGAVGLAHRDRRHRSVAGGAGKIQGRHLQPVRGAARPADPDAGEVFHAGRRTLAAQCRDPRHGAASAAQSAAGLLPSRHVRHDLLPQRADLFRPGAPRSASSIGSRECWSPTACWRWARPKPWSASPTPSSPMRSGAGSIVRTSAPAARGGGYADARLQGRCASAARLTEPASRSTEMACGRKRDVLPVIGFSSSRIDRPHGV